MSQTLNRVLTCVDCGAIVEGSMFGLDPSSKRCQRCVREVCDEHFSAALQVFHSNLTRYLQSI